MLQDSEIIWRGRTALPVTQGKYVALSRSDYYLSSVLGSCVSICLFDETVGIGGMNHYLLPFSEASDNKSTKYGAMSIELLINELLKLGAVRSDIKARIFGGASVSRSSREIGARNLRFGKNFLENEGFEIVSECIGGNETRKVQFHPCSGIARVRSISDPIQLEQKPTEIERAFDKSAKDFLF